MIGTDHAEESIIVPIFYLYKQIDPVRATKETSCLCQNHWTIPNLALTLPTLIESVKRVYNQLLYHFRFHRIRVLNLFNLTTV